MANSKALIRVKNNKRTINQPPTSEGIFLSNNQLIALGNALKNLGSVDGALFMIGKDSVAGKVVQTVEILAYENVGAVKKVYNQGHLNINLGKAEPNSPMATMINNDVPLNQTFTSVAPAMPAGVVAFDDAPAGITRGSQRTPPPSIDI